jgi:transposase
MPIKFTITEGTTADCRLAITLIENIPAETLIADKGYDTNEILEFAAKHEIQVVIPPKSNRIIQREYDEHLYKYRHLVENAFLKLKRWRGVATRYTKTTAAFCGTVTLACIVLWLRVLS